MEFETISNNSDIASVGSILNNHYSFYPRSNLVLNRTHYCHMGDKLLVLGMVNLNSVNHELSLFLECYSIRTKQMEYLAATEVKSFFTVET